MEKGFLVNYQKIDDRFDPEFYHPSYFEILDTVEEWEKISNVYTNISHPPEYERKYSAEGLQLIRSQNVRPAGINFHESPVFFSQEFLKKKKVVYPKKGDILIVRSGVNAGDVAVVEESTEKAIVGADTLLLQVDNTFVPKFIQVFFYTDIGKKLMNRYVTGATNKHVSPSFLKKVPLPKISSENQKKCISLFEESLEAKAQKEAEAEKLLNSIDNYLLSKLGIELPEKDTSLANRMFTTSFRSVSGKRYDPKPYDNHSQNLFDAVKNSKYPKTLLKKLVIDSSSGKWGKSTDSKVKEEKYHKCLVIRATEFDNLYNLKLENDRAKYRLIKKRHLKKLDINANDLLIEKSGGSPDQPVGRIALLRKELVENNTLCFSNFVHKIRIDESQVLPEYLFSFLKTIHNIKITEIMQSQTSGIRNLIMGEYFNQQIVIPEKSKQRKIAAEINERRFKSQQLEKEARQEVENARRRVEEMILEED